MSDPRIAILHVALNPRTGPWNVMKRLAAEQAGSGRYADVAMGIVADRAWRGSVYAKELSELGSRRYVARTPRMFGTASCLYQLVRPPGIERWVQDLAVLSGTDVVVHFHSSWLAGVFLPLRPVAGVKVAVAATLHGVNERFVGKPVRHAIHRWIAARMQRYGAAVTSVDEYNVSMAGKILGLRADAITVIPNGVPPGRNNARPFLEGSDCFTLGHLGSLTPQKGWRLGCEVALRLAAEGRKVRFVVAGAGPDEAEVRQMAERHRPVVTFEGFAPDPQESIMPGLDLLTVMSEREGLPMVIMEAMSVGLPVAATAVGGDTGGGDRRADRIPGAAGKWSPGGRGT